jgi:hypothetical protein
MPKTSNINLGGRLKVILASINGEGKTRGLASFPTPMYIFDFDNRLNTIKKDFPDADIEYDTYGIHNFKDADKKLEQLQKRCSYATVALDGISSMTTAAVLYSMGETGGKTVAGMAVPGFEEYSLETTVVTKFLEIFKMLPAHVVVTVHPVDRLNTTGQGKSMKITKVKSIVTYGSKLCSIIPNYFDEVWALQSGTTFDGKKERFIYTETDDDNDIVCKTSLPLPARMLVTNRKLFEVIQEELEKKGIKLENSKPTSNGPVVIS